MHVHAANLCMQGVKSLLSPQNTNVESRKERSSPPKTLNPLCYFDEDAEVPGGEADAPKHRKEVELSNCMRMKKAWKKNRRKERKEGVGTGWDERARGEDAVPMVHQKLMPTASVSTSRSGKTTHANSLEFPASALPPTPPRLLRPPPVLPLTLARGPSDQLERGSYEL